MSRNVEVKVRVDDLDALRSRLRALGAKDHGRIRQTDTYFGVPAESQARLKIREQNPGNNEVIAYRRPDTEDLRTSNYLLWSAPDIGGLKAALSFALGTRATVVKERHLFLLGRTRVHLDQVEGKGSFLELEVVLGPEDGEEEAERILADLDLQTCDRIAGSYAEL